MIRKYTEEDFNKIIQLHKNYGDEFEFNHPSEPNVLDSAIVGNGLVTGFGLVRNIAEVLMLIDKNLGSFTRGKALTELLENAAIVARLNNHDQIHAFVQDKIFSEHLKVHFGFRNTKGEALVKDI